MKVNIENCINHVLANIDKKTKQRGGYVYTVEEFIKNLKELRERKAEGETVIDEFFGVYVFNGDQLR